MACASQILWLCSFLFENILYERHDCLIISSPISLFTESSETTDGHGKVWSVLVVKLDLL